MPWYQTRFLSPEQRKARTERAAALQSLSLTELSRDADLARADAIALLSRAASGDADPTPELLTAQAQVWATLAVSLELASGVETL